MTTEEIIKSRFVTPKHFDAISNVILETRHTGCAKLNVIISFREAGEHTIKMLSAGAGAKPHSILAKSIKDGTLSEKDKTVTGMDRRGTAGTELGKFSGRASLYTCGAVSAGCEISLQSQERL